MGQKKQQEGFKGMAKDEIKAYQKILSEVNLYDDKIDGIAGPKTRKGSDTFQMLTKKGYSKSQIFRHTIGAPHMSDKEWGDYIGGKRGFQKPKIEDAVIDSMKKEY